MTFSIPHSESTEKAVVSVCLQNDDRLDDLVRLGGLDMFHLNRHSRLLSLMMERKKEGKTNELISLTEALKGSELEKIGGPSGLAELYSFATNSQHFEQHIKVLLDMQVRKKGKILSDKLGALSPEGSPEEINKLIEDSMRDMAHEVNEEASNSDLAKRALGNLQSVLSGAEEKGVDIGFQQVQRKTGRWKGNQLVIIAARPGSGKTSFMMNLIDHVSISAETPSLVFSMEMTADQLAERYIYGSSGLNFRDLANQKPIDGKRSIGKGSIQEIRRSLTKFTGSKARIIDESGMTLERIASIARADVRERGSKMIFVDYLQIMKTDKSLPRERQIAEISAGLKALAKELDITVVLLAQLNRQSEHRATGIPKESDLRESGSIEQDADTVILLHRLIHSATSVEERMEAGNKALIIVGKCRSGETGYVQARFIAEQTKFIEQL